MRILFVGNNQTQRCGVAEWGRHCVAALRKLGHEVWDWDWKTDCGPSYTHDDYHGQHDVVLVNWHAGTLGWQEFDVGARGCLRSGGVLSAYLHESSPAWNEPQHRPPLLDQVDVAFVDHPAVEAFVTGGPPTGTMHGDLASMRLRSAVIYFRTPVWDVVPKRSTWRDPIVPVIGASGIREEGVAAIDALCGRYPWSSNAGSNDVWLSAQDEVDRLAESWINVAHYGAGFGGQASAMGALIAAGQPILINSNRMLETWREFAEPGESPVHRLYGRPPQLYLDDDLERGLLTILADIRDGKARRPTWLRAAFSWPRQAERMVAEWERRLVAA